MIWLFLLFIGFAATFWTIGRYSVWVTIFALGLKFSVLVIALILLASTIYIVLKKTKLLDRWKTRNEKILSNGN
jgi:hypothetical protein